MAKALLHDHRTCYRDWVKFNEECSKECIRDKIHFCEHHIANETGSNTYFSSTLLIQNSSFHGHDIEKYFVHQELCWEAFQVTLTIIGLCININILVSKRKYCYQP